MRWTRVLLIAVVVVAVFAVGFLLFERAAAPEREPEADTAVSPSPTTLTATDTPFPCPQATPELLAVEPVTSPTDQLTQVITVTLGNGERITVTGESGTVSAAASFPTLLELPLLPDTTHHLTVTGKVKRVVQGDCIYGDYTLTTFTDRYGDPLVIETE